MESFANLTAARAYVETTVDRPVTAQKETIDGRLLFRSVPVFLKDGTFTNSYDVSYRRDSVKPVVSVRNPLTSVYDFIIQNKEQLAAVSGGFFFLADRCGTSPRQLALNLAVSEGQLRSIPVADQEAVICKAGRLSAAKLQALGALSLNGSPLYWSGSKTAHEADCQVFGNGNSIISHLPCDTNGSTRTFYEDSRFTPAMDLSEEKTDVGFLAIKDGPYVGIDYSETGAMDIFQYDAVVRCPKKYLKKGETQKMQLLTVDTLALDGSVEGALSVGPFLSEADFHNHNINKDPSLGSRPPFTERRMARIALYETIDNMVHIRLFDGRPGSQSFQGVTPSEAASIIDEEEEIFWGCFLDPGQTAKLCVRKKDTVSSYGNTHYLKWPIISGQQYSWEPLRGRPVASIIALQ